jgi:signal transduction histidine kinase
MLIIIVVSIPAFFYISIEKKSYKQTEMQSMEHYAYGVEKSIYDFSRTNKHIFNFPRSLFYAACLYDAKGEELFTTDEALCAESLRVDRESTLLRKRVTLSPNRLQAKYLVILKEFSYKSIYVKAFISALFLGSIIFLMTLFFIKISQRPLERINRYLKVFFNDAMHELKTPLGVMQLNIEILRSQEENKVLRRVYNSMQNMILIYEDIEYHIKHTHVTYHPEKIDFSRFLQSRIDVFKDIAKVKDIEIRIEIAQDIFLMLNRIELQRIIDNTLSNAIKYSPKRSLIEVKLYREVEHVVFSVEDQGIGIKDTQKIFKRYQREDVIQGGFGIGLDIVKHICDKNSIEITVVTKLHEGSTFIYRFLEHKL